MGSYGEYDFVNINSSWKHNISDRQYDIATKNLLGYKIRQNKTYEKKTKGVWSLVFL